jgi:Phage P22-like portal protein
MFGGDITKKEEPNLISLKRNVEQSWQYSRHNYQRWQEFMAMTFRSALSDQDRESLRYIGRPPIESMIIAAHTSRIQGEFARQQFNVDVHPSEGIRLDKLSKTYIRDLEVLQAHLNETLLETSNGKFQYNLFQDVLVGAFGVAKLDVDFINPRSFLQRINIQKIANPCLTGFDPLATERHKGDGRYAFQLYPMTQEEFQLEYGKDLTKKISFTRSLQSFNWSYINAREKIVLVCEFFEKETKNANLLLLSDQTTMLESKYNEMLKNWNKFAVPPTEMDRRQVQVTEIKRSEFCETEIMKERQKTYHEMLPLVYFDGRSVMIADNIGGSGGQNRQFTIPYGFPAKDAQRLKNVAMQTLGHELEGMMQHKIMIAKEAVPQDPKYVEAYTHPQKEACIVWEQFVPDRPEMKNEPPQILARPPVPSIIMETYQAMDQTIQACFGSYDAILGINGKEISGKAIQQGAMQSDASVMPYLVGFQTGLERCAEIIVNLIPKVYITPRTIPIRLPDGTREHIVIKESVEGDSIEFNYDPHEISVKIESGVNSNIQKQLAVEQITTLMNTSETFKAFMERKGLPVLLKNIDIRGIEGLEDKVEDFMAEIEKERQQAGSQPSDTDKIVNAEIHKTELEAEARDQKTQADMAVNIAKVAVEKEKVENDRLELELKAMEVGARLHIDRENQAAQAASDTINLAVGVMKHQHEVDMAEKQAEQQPQGAPPNG